MNIIEWMDHLLIAGTTFVISSDGITIDSMKKVDFKNNSNKDFDELNAIESDKKIIMDSNSDNNIVAPTDNETESILSDSDK